MDTVWGIAAFLVMCGAILLFQWWSRTRVEARKQAEDARVRAEDEQFWKAAKVAHAQVLSSHQNGMVNLKPCLQVSLRIDAADGPYDVETEWHVDYTDLHRLAKGSRIEVYVDPKNRARAVLCHLDPDDDRRIRRTDD